MASCSLFLALRRECRNRFFLSSRFKSLPGSYEAGVSNYCSSGALSSELTEESTSFEENDDLKSRIFRLRLPKRSATNVLERWVSEGNQMTISELRQISKELRKLQRHKHALEISEWMVSHDEFNLSDSDYATRIDLMAKVFGIDAAERYFESLPSSSKSCETYTALLHSCARAKWTEKAEDLYQRIKDSDLPFTALTYNEMMTLYMSVGQIEKVSSIVEEMKQRKVTLDIFTYNLWISSCAASLEIDNVSRILVEMSCESSSNEDWGRYITLAKIYIKWGNFLDESKSNSIVESEKGIITWKEWITYDFLIILYAGLGDKDRINQIWNSLRMTKQKMTSRNYVCVLSSYLMLSDLEEVGEVIDQWKQSTATGFDGSACTRLLDAFVEARSTEKAQRLLEILIQKNCGPEDLSKYEAQGIKV